VFSRILGPKGDEIIGKWRELHNLYASIKVTTTVISRRMKTATHKTQTETSRMHTEF
jgi:hypothetical protein